MPPFPPPSSSASPAPTMDATKALSDAELRLAKLEALLADRIAQQAKDDADKGIVPRAIDRVFGKSWSTSFYGLLAGAGGIVGVVPDSGHPILFGMTLHQLAGGASAIGMLMVGLSSKSKNVTGAERAPKAAE